MNRGAELALPHVQPFPGTCWTVIIRAIPKDASGHTRSYRHCIAPLAQAGLLATHYREVGNDRREMLYYLTDAGLAEIKRLSPNTSASGVVG